jgi:hypothetical protein
MLVFICLLVLMSSRAVVEMDKHSPRDVDTPGSIGSVGSPVIPLSPGLTLLGPDLEHANVDVGISPIKRAATEPNVRRSQEVTELNIETPGKPKRSGSSGYNKISNSATPYADSDNDESTDIIKLEELNSLSRDSSQHELVTPSDKRDRMAEFCTYFSSICFACTCC